jgi:hypothetical protein
MIANEYKAKNFIIKIILYIIPKYKRTQI